jgi:predicted nucleic acid-binding protein
LSGFLLDTCVLSEFKKPRPDSGLYSWLANLDAVTAFISAITVGELRFGIALLPNSAKRRDLERWLSSDVMGGFSGRVIPFDYDVADRWGLVRARARAKGTTLPPIDAMIAATALHKNLTVVTRNEEHFSSTGVAVTNPWASR